MLHGGRLGHSAIPPLRSPGVDVGSQGCMSELINAGSSFSSHPRECRLSRSSALQSELSLDQAIPPLRALLSCFAHRFLCWWNIRPEKHEASICSSALLCFWEVLQMGSGFLWVSWLVFGLQLTPWLRTCYCLSAGCVYIH